MKILLSAYACEPNKGSEPGVGWHWAVELAKLGHEVWVITRCSNRAAIELEKNKLDSTLKLHFVFADLPAWCVRLKAACKNLTYHGYYLLWQWVAFKQAKKLHEVYDFDTVHHVTYVSIRHPSFMGLLGIPFTFGPVAGGETIPQKLRAGLPLKGKLRDGLRDSINRTIKFDPLMNLTFQTASRIIVSSEQTRQLLPKRFQHKSAIQLAIGSDNQKADSINENLVRASSHSPNGPFRILYVGHLLYLKGLHLALPAFKQVLQQYPNIEFTIIGNGEEEQWIKSVADALDLNKSVRWINWMPQDELFKQYRDYDLFLFPSLRDSGGMVVLEAMERGLPVVCFDLGGPGVIVDETCGSVIATENLSEKAVVAKLTEVLKRLIKLGDLTDLKKGAIERAEKFHWSQLVQTLYP